ncbi:mechanosensitive ion channel protein 10-like [Malania oleifera]|uniref:mechanosensitive ion channel protein 10-like n=1 Tax=Malania oleifera TaxID=397392 RepID=UPI0025AE5896|nr:mechanosensitive ion channel protein 10-like [Malania oleifera]
MHLLVCRILMDSNEKGVRGGEIGLSEKKLTNGSEVVVAITSEREENGVSSLKDQETSFPKQGNVYLQNRVSASPPVSCSSPEIARFSPSPNKPPVVPRAESLTRRRSLVRLAFSKPKSRFGEQPIDPSLFEENEQTLLEQDGNTYTASSPFRNLSNKSSPNNNKGSEVSRTISITPKTPLMASPGRKGEEEAEEIYRRVNKKLSEKHRRVKAKVLIEWVAFVSIMGCLVASLCVPRLEQVMIWGLEIWKWCVLVMVIFCGMLFTSWFIHIVVFIIERNFLLRKKVLYFVHGLKKSVQVFIWLGLVLLSWVLLFDNGVERSKTAEKILNFVSWTLVSLLIGAFLWLLKTLLLKILASNFHVNTFFDRVQDSIFHQYVLKILSGPPVVELAQRVGRAQSSGQLSFVSTKSKDVGKEKEVIDMAKLHDMKRDKVSAWTMKLLIDVASSGLSTISNTLDESVNDGAEQADKEITNEMEAMAAAYHIFRNVAQPGFKYIDEDDLLRFMTREEVERVFSLFEGLETRQIDRKTLTDWVVNVYKGRKALAHALTDTKTAVKQLNKLVTGILIVVVIVVWLLLMEIATTKLLVLLSSQLVVAAFMFGNTCKTIFEAIIFVFVMHPFDVGDRCVIDGVQMIVEEMNIFTTVFLRYDNEKIYYPNTVLATKPISNFYRSPDMGDSVEFSIDFMTPVERIAALKDRIKKYLEKNPQHWHPSHSVVVKDIENVNKIKMAVYFNHTMNFQNFGEKTRRRSELVIELKRLFEELNIKYNLLPQEVRLSSVGSAASSMLPR